MTLVVILRDVALIGYSCQSDIPNNNRFICYLEAGPRRKVKHTKKKNSKKCSHFLFFIFSFLLKCIKYYLKESNHIDHE